jgi:hypothetical protein
MITPELIIAACTQSLAFGLSNTGVGLKSRRLVFKVPAFMITPELIIAACTQSLALMS